MTAAAGRDQKIVLSGETHAGYDIGGASTPCNNSRPPINHGVRNGADSVVAVLAGAKDYTPDCGPELLNSGMSIKVPPSPNALALDLQGFLSLLKGAQ